MACESHLVPLPAGGSLLVVDHRPERDGGRPPLLLLHALGGTGGMWARQVAALAPERRIILCDLRGHGASSPPPGTDWTMADLVDDVRVVLARLSPGRVVLAGVSIGGMTGIGVALTAPELLEGLVAAATRADMPEGSDAVWDKRLEIARRDSMAALADETVSRWLDPDFREKNGEVAAALREDIATTSIHGYEGCVNAIRSLDYFHRLGEIRVPVCYVSGAGDPVMSPAVMRPMYRATPGARHIILSPAAHMPQLECHREFSRILQTFPEAPAAAPAGQDSGRQIPGQGGPR